VLAHAGWPIAVAYVIGFFVMLAVLGWHPDAPLIMSDVRTRRIGRPEFCRSVHLHVH
jgi:hypothetical protein